MIPFVSLRYVKESGPVGAARTSIYRESIWDCNGLIRICRSTLTEGSPPHSFTTEVFIGGVTSNDRVSLGMPPDNAVHEIDQIAIAGVLPKTKLKNITHTNHEYLMAVLAMRGEVL